MMWLKGIAEVGGLRSMFVVGQVLSVLEVFENNVTDSVLQGGNPGEKGLHAVGGTGDRAKTHETDAHRLQLLERQVQPPVKDLPSRSRLEVSQNQWFSDNGLFNENVVGRLLPDRNPLRF